MPEPIITLTTDFGEQSPYVAAMKGVILAVNPAARILDLSHAVPPQNLLHAAIFLRDAIPFFPPGVIHVVVVDPGVGSARALLCVKVSGHRLLVPDNGCWSLLEARDSSIEVRELREPLFWRRTVSATFHGRDILAPVAAHLSLGVPPAEVGPLVTSWKRLVLPLPRLERSRIHGEIVFIDHFGNLITNIPGSQIEDGRLRVHIKTRVIERFVQTYATAEPGTLVALVSSTGFLEIAAVEGNANHVLDAVVGTRVTVSGGSDHVE